MTATELGIVVGQKVTDANTIIIEVVKTKNELAGLVNTTTSQTKINSAQNQRKYQFNSPSNSYLSNSSQYTLSDSIQFAVLDDINALLDTAIFLYNKGNTIKASAYIEMALFGAKQIHPRTFEPLLAKKIPMKRELKTKIPLSN